MTKIMDKAVLDRRAFMAAFAGAAMLPRSVFAGELEAQDLAAVYSAFSEGSTQAIDHSLWAAFLERFAALSNDGIVRVRYGAVDAPARADLKRYLEALAAVMVSDYGRAEQFSFWINFYNALTMEVVLAHYPVASIRDIDISPGLFANGPWGKKLVRVMGQDLSLDNIEHDILRVLWREPRVHYAANCAAIGCPNLTLTPYRGAALEAQLVAAAQDYIRHERGVYFGDGGLKLSRLYDWYKEDFGNRAELFSHIGRHLREPEKSRLAGYDGGIDYEYDWALNDSAG